MSRSTYGSAPKWSSWPCVMRNARTSSLRSRKKLMSGRTRSMPSISSRGNARPQSTTTILPRYSTAVMFLPISPIPPSGMILSVFSAIVFFYPLCQSYMRPPAPALGAVCRRPSNPCVAALEQSEPLELAFDQAPFVVGGFDERQAQAADLVAEHVQGRLQRYRVARHEERRDQRRKF